jgi:hypothetical protein
MFELRIPMSSFASFRSLVPVLQAAQIENDTYSWQASLASDKLFWIRVEHTADQIVVTDYKQGSQTAEFLAETLLELLILSKVTQIQTLLFMDIVPRSDIPFQLRGLDILQRRTVIDVALARIAYRIKRKVEKVELQQVGRKINLLAIF